MKTWIKGVIAFVVWISVMFAGNFLYTSGQTSGMQNYHNQCFDVGGLIMDEEGRVVQCAPLTIVPKQELPNFKTDDRLTT